ncbi:hypothetical protein CLOP_g4000, partial [Closterium sp. NIES-67]
LKLKAAAAVAEGTAAAAAEAPSRPTNATLRSLVHSTGTQVSRDASSDCCSDGCTGSSGHSCSGGTSIKVTTFLHLPFSDLSAVITEYMLARLTSAPCRSDGGSGSGSCSGSRSHGCSGNGCGVGGSSSAGRRSDTLPSLRTLGSSSQQQWPYHQSRWAVASATGVMAPGTTAAVSAGAPAAVTRTCSRIMVPPRGAEDSSSGDKRVAAVVAAEQAAAQRPAARAAEAPAVEAQVCKLSCHSPREDAMWLTAVPSIPSN